MVTNKGFTLIELVMVIVILGILSAFALPRFANLQTEARIAVLQGALGAAKSGAAIAHAKALASNQSNATFIDIEGEQIRMRNGYPDATINGIMPMIQLEWSDFVPNNGGVPVPSGYAGIMQFLFRGTPNCYFEYYAASPNGSPGYGIETTGC